MATTLPAAGKSGRYGDLKRRLLFLLGALVVFRIGAHIPVPGIDPNVLADLFKSQQGGILGMFNMFSGGALSRFTIFALGIMPYISASIIIQLMTTVSPTLEALKKEGEAGRKIMNQYTRYLTVMLAAFQAYGIAIGLEGAGNTVAEPGWFFRISTTITLVGGTMFLMWLGEQITSRGIGNGISLIITVGILARYPIDALNTYRAIQLGQMTPFKLLLIVLMMVLIIAVVWIQPLPSEYPTPRTSRIGQRIRDQDGDGSDRDGEIPDVAEGGQAQTEIDHDGREFLSQPAVLRPPDQEVRHAGTVAQVKVKAAQTGQKYQARQQSAPLDPGRENIENQKAETKQYQQHQDIADPLDHDGRQRPCSADVVIAA